MYIFISLELSEPVFDVQVTINPFQDTDDKGIRIPACFRVHKTEDSNLVNF